MKINDVFVLHSRKGILIPYFALIVTNSVVGNVSECTLEWEETIPRGPSDKESYFPLYDPTILERFRKSVLGEDLLISCKKYIAIRYLPVCVFDTDPRKITYYHLHTHQNFIRIEKTSCENINETSSDSTEMHDRTTVLIADFEHGRVGDVLEKFQNQFGAAWQSIEQLIFRISVCDEILEMGHDIGLAQDLSSFYSKVESAGFQVFSTLPIPGELNPPDLLVACGFPSDCIFEVGYIRSLSSSNSQRLPHFSKISESSIPPGRSTNDTTVLSWDGALVLGHFNGCSNEGLIELDLKTALIAKYRWSFPGMHTMSLFRNPLRYTAAECRIACELNVECRSFSLLGERMNAESQCVGCMDAAWNPYKRARAATGVIDSNATWQRWKGGEEAFFLQGEPKGGWTLSDMTGLVHSTDLQMLDWAIQQPAAVDDAAGRQSPSADGGPAHRQPEASESMQQAGIGMQQDASKHPDAWLLQRATACSGRPRAAVIYLVGSREDDMEALGLSLACLDRYFLAAQNYCYPVYFFREAWDDAAQLRVRLLTNAQPYFLVADMSFPNSFNGDGVRSQQSKRSEWGYQHMSRFWLRTVLEHPAVASLEWYLRLDTDSRFTTPLLDLFADARARGVAYGYRVAGKDWLGRNRGLWAWHREYVQASGWSEEQARAAGGLLQLVLRGHAGDGTEAPIFYTNFELVSVARFRAADMWDYVTAADASLGIYVHNWGDAQLRWLQVSTLLPAAAVHRYCHFGYVHGAAATPAFGCWQEPWIGLDCPAAACSLHGRHPARLLPPDTPRIVFGPPLPARGAAAGSISVDGVCSRGTASRATPARRRDAEAMAGRRGRGGDAQDRPVPREPCCDAGDGGKCSGDAEQVVMSCAADADQGCGGDGSGEAWGRRVVAQYRVWWMGAGAKRMEMEAGSGAAEVRCVEAGAAVQEADRQLGQIVVEYAGARAHYQVSALVLELVSKTAVSSPRRDGPDEGRWWRGRRTEAATFVFAVEEGGWGEGGEDMAGVGPGWDGAADLHVEMPWECEGDVHPDCAALEMSGGQAGNGAPETRGGSRAEARSEGLQDDDCLVQDRVCLESAALRSWYHFMRWALLSEEYVSRFLRAQQGRSDVRDLPEAVEALLQRRDPAALPYRARLVAVHWVVLVLLGQPGAVRGLAELLSRYATACPSRRQSLWCATAACHPVWQPGLGCGVSM